MGVSKLKFGGVLVNSVTTNSLTTHKVRINGNLVYDDSQPTWTGLKFTSVGYNTLQFIQQGNWVGTWPIEYSRDNGETWREYTLSTTFNLSDGATVCFRGQKDSTSQSEENYRKFYIGGTGTVNVSGDVTSLLNGVGGVTDLTPYGNYTLTQLFDGCSSITSAPTLPSTTLAESCYSRMFYDCTGLTSTPLLPATTLATYCYKDMFEGCESLVTSMDTLPATTLATECYSGMFHSCTSMTSSPTLPATTLATNCYKGMFRDCVRLDSAPELPATTLSEGCYDSMFYGCTSITSAPELPATTMVLGCYTGMFLSCTSLTTAPSLPATTLAISCYNQMFEGCTSLTTAPDLPATTLAEACYAGMLNSCSSLISAPALPATSVAINCYYGMFNGCTSLVTAPDLSATTLARSCYKYMFANCPSLTGPVNISASSPYWDGTDSACTNMFVSSGTDRPATPEGYRTINVGGGLSTDWVTAATIDTNYWDVVSPTVYHTVTFSCTNGSVGATVDGIGIQSGESVAYGKTAIFTITPNEGYEYTGTNPESVVVHDNVERNYECTPVSTWTGLKFVSEGTSTMKWTKYGSGTTHAKDIEYSIDQGANWVSLTSAASSSATAVSFTEMWVRGTNTQYATSTTKYNYFVFGGSNVAVSGNIMSLINAISFESLTTLSATYTFYNLFKNQTLITSCPTLPATTLKASCYYNMFGGCTNIVDGPVLPASALVSSCYKSMFYNCTKLTSLTCLATSGVNTTNLNQWTYGIATTGVFTWNGTTWPGFSKNTLMTGNGVPQKWSLNPPYYVTLNASATNGSIAATVGGEPVQLPYEALWASSAVLTVTPDSGYGFSQWSDGNTANPRALSMTQAYNLTATCGTLRIVTFSCQHGSVVAKVGTTVIQSGDQVPEGKTVVFTITPDEGYEYTGTNPESVVVSGDVTKNYVCTQIWNGLTFTANTAGSTISFNQVGTFSGSWPIETSTDGSTWSSYTLGTVITLTNVGDYVRFRGQKDSTAQTYTIYRKFVMTGSIAASGDITSLLNGTGGVSDLTSYGNYTFCRMFNGCTSLTTAPSLPATTLASNCYYNMFYGCTALTSAPSLPATTLTGNCYDNMFNGCTSLTTAPSLPATTLAIGCYQSMFADCTSLTTAPTLPATGISDKEPYNSMFVNCISLTGPVTIYASSPRPSEELSECYDMFYNTGTSRPSTPTGYNKIKVGGNVSLWNSENCGIDSTYWTVELITEGDIEEQ